MGGSTGAKSWILALVLSLLLQAAPSAPVKAGSTFRPDEINPDIATNGQVSLVVWSDLRNGSDFDIYAARVAPDGTVLDPDGFPVSTGPGSGFSAEVVWNGRDFFVVWEDDRDEPGYGRDVIGARVTTDGQVLDRDGIRISPPDREGQRPVLAWNGTHHLVVWDQWDGSGDTYLVGRRVTAEGVISDAEPIIIGYTDQASTAISVAGGTWLVTWIASLSRDLFARRVAADGRLLGEAILVSETAGLSANVAAASNGMDHLVVWEDDRDGYDQDDRLFAARVSASGILLDPSGIAVASGPGEEYGPDAAWNGEAYVIVWSRRYEDDIYARTVDALGRVGAESVITTANAEQYSAAIDSAGSSTFATWTDTRSLEDSDIYGRHIDTAGRGSGEEVAISTIGRTPRKVARELDIQMRRHLVARGEVGPSDRPTSCRAGVPVVIQRRRSGAWIRWARGTTDATGDYRIKVRDRAGRYRAVAPAVTEGNLTCERTVSAPRRHRH